MHTNPISEIDPIGAQTLEVISEAKNFNFWMYSKIAPFCHGNILEIGSGIGNISSFLLDQHQDVTLSDINPDYCVHLQNKFNISPSLKEIISLNLVQHDFEYAFVEYLEKFDTIVLLNVIEHIEAHDLAIQNAFKLLASGGHLILLAPSYSYLYSPLDKNIGHYRRYNKTSLQHLLTNNGFRIRTSFYFNFAGLPGWLIFGKFFQKKTLGSGEVSLFEKFVPIIKFIDFFTNKIAGLSIISIGIK